MPGGGGFWLSELQEKVLLVRGVVTSYFATSLLSRGAAEVPVEPDGRPEAPVSEKIFFFFFFNFLSRGLSALFC